MTIRKYCYTDRKRLKRKHIKISPREESNERICFDVEVNLSEYGLPRDALVFVEAYRQDSFRRESFGRVGELVSPKIFNLTPEFDSHEGVLFRVRVTSSIDPKGQSLAEADRISLDEGSAKNREALLPVKGTDDIPGIWNVDFAEEKPILEISRNVGDWKGFAKSPEFISLAFPAILKEILTRILVIERHFDADGDDWCSKWLVFAKNLVGGIPTADDFMEEDHGKIIEWIDHAVDVFCQKQKIKERFGKSHLNASA